MRQFFFYLFSFFSLGLVFCASVASSEATPSKAADFKSESALYQTSGKKLKVLSFNIWHGLTPKGAISMEYLVGKTREHFDRRVEAQIKAIKDLDPDLIFLQEVNPVTEISKKYAKALNMDFIYLIDNCGVKVFQLGIPQPLFSGLVILAKKGLKLKLKKKVKLSGSFGFCHPILSLQFSEFRFALFGSISLEPEKEVLLVNTHLHHAFNPSFVIGPLVETAKKASLNELQTKAFTDQVYGGEERRLAEVNKLLSTIESLKGQKNYFTTILAGDLNDIVESKTVQKVLKGCPEEKACVSFKPAYTFRNTPKPTYDTKKSKTRAFQVKFSFPYKAPEELTEKQKTLINSVFIRANDIPKKIDYIFLGPSIKVTSYSLFGDEPYSNLFLSDHFGVLADIEIKLKP